MNIAWIHIPAMPGAGVDEQWQARAPHGGVGVFTRAYCQHPLCSCVVHVHHGERRDVHECESPSWRGVVIGPDGVVQDVEMSGARPTLENARAEFERILEQLWEASDAEV